MTIQEQINALKKEFADKIAELEKQAKAEEKQNNVWKPKEGESCWAIFSNGIDNICWHDTELNNKAYFRGNIVKTQSEAEWADQHRIVATELKNFVIENDPNPITEKDWKDESVKKCSIIYNHRTNIIYNNDTLTWRSSDQVYASNKEVLEKAIKHIGEERLKKYYFGVKE